MALTLDAGALIAVDRGDRAVHALLKHETHGGHVTTVPAPVVGQVWRDGARQARLARLLRGCRVEPTTERDARAAGELLGAAGQSDVVDALVVLVAARSGDEIVTSDPTDLRSLVEAQARPVTVTVV